jgi:hypothetical protein
MTDTPKKELKKQIDAKYKEFEATIYRRAIRIKNCNQKIDENKRSIKGFENVLREKHSEKTYAFIRTELCAAQKTLGETKTNLSELRKAFDCAEKDLKTFLEKTFGSPVRRDPCNNGVESFTVLQYGKYNFVEVEKNKY